MGREDTERLGLWEKNILESRARFRPSRGGDTKGPLEENIEEKPDSSSHLPPTDTLKLIPDQELLSSHVKGEEKEDSEVSNCSHSRRSNSSIIPWNLLAETWNRKAWFPTFMGHDLPTFARFIFWHSISLTVITPLVRAVTGVWTYRPSDYLQRYLEMDTAEFPDHQDNNSAHRFAYLVDGHKPLTAENDPMTDMVWIMHATAGLAWVCVSYLQIAIIPKYAPRNWHRRTGPAALLVLFIHLLVGLITLTQDQQQHSTINKVVLLGTLTSAGTFATIATYKAVRYLLNPGDLLALREHKEHMVTAWLWSISGAGPIRMVTFVMDPLGYGPLYCQEAYDSVSSNHCLWSYYNRMMMLANWNLLMTGCYCKIRQDIKVTSDWLKNLTCHITVCIIFAILRSLPGSTVWVDSVMGAAGTTQSWLITYILSIAQAFLLTFIPVLIMLGHGSGICLLYLTTMVFASFV